MASYTTNYNLKKPAQSDNVNIGDFNDNADIIDATLYSKVDKVTGKGLSTNDFTTDEKNKLAGIAAGATAVTLPIAATNISETTGRTFVTSAQATTIGKAVTLDNYVRSAAYATTSGTSTAYTATLTYPITQYTEGMRITIVPHADNGASPTLAVSGLTAIPLIDKNGDAIEAGALKSGMPYEFLYRNANFIQLGEGGEKATVISGDVTVGSSGTPGTSVTSISISGLSDYFNSQPQFIFLTMTSNLYSSRNISVNTILNNQVPEYGYYYLGSSGSSAAAYKTPIISYSSGTLTITQAADDTTGHFRGTYSYLLMNIE